MIQVYRTKIKSFYKLNSITVVLIWQMVKTEYMHMAIVLVCIHVDSKQYNEQSNGQCRHRLFDLGLN